MSYWLLKTEPSVYSFDDLQKDRKTVWDGVTNNLALKHLRSVKKGDQALIYHTGDEKQIVGIAQAVSEPYPDPDMKNPKLVVVNLRPKRRLGRPVTLAEIKSRKEFSSFELVRLPRLSVMPVSEATWEKILKLGK